MIIFEIVVRSRNESIFVEHFLVELHDFLSPPFALKSFLLLALLLLDFLALTSRCFKLCLTAFFDSKILETKLNNKFYDIKEEKNTRLEIRKFDQLER